MAQKRKISGTIVGTAICEECSKHDNDRIDVAIVDNGIGRTDYWGSVSTHHQWGFECTRCGNQIMQDRISFIDSEY